MQPIYTLGFDRCLANVAPSVATVTLQKTLCKQIKKRKGGGKGLGNPVPIIVI